MNYEEDFFDGIVGGEPLAPEKTNPHVSEPVGVVVVSKIDKRLARLMTLHPNLQLQFRSNNFAAMSEHDKLKLLEDFQEILGIEPLGNE